MVGDADPALRAYRTASTHLATSLQRRTRRREPVPRRRQRAVPPSVHRPDDRLDSNVIATARRAALMRLVSAARLTNRSPQTSSSISSFDTRRSDDARGTRTPPALAAPTRHHRAVATRTHVYPERIRRTRSHSPDRATVPGPKRPVRPRRFSATEGSWSVRTSHPRGAYETGRPCQCDQDRHRQPHLGRTGRRISVRGPLYNAITIVIVAYRVRVATLETRLRSAGCRAGKPRIVEG